MISSPVRSIRDCRTSSLKCCKAILHTRQLLQVFCGGCLFLLTMREPPGRAEYFSEDEPQRLADVIKASCSVPVLCSPVAIGGKHYLDGSVSDSVGARHLVRTGCDKVVAVLTRPKGAGRTDYTRLSPILKKLYGERFPALYSCLMERSKSSAREMNELEQLEREGRIFILRPTSSAPPKFTEDEKLICDFYAHGRQRALENINRIGDFIK